MRVKFHLAILLGLALPAAALVTFIPGPGRARWHRLEFTDQWTMPPTTASRYQKTNARLSFRVHGHSLFVAFAQPYQGHPTSISSNRRVVDLTNGLVRNALPAEWERAKPIATHVENPFRELPAVQGAGVSYLRRLFPASGKVLERYATSPDGSWLAIMSYTRVVDQEELGAVDRGKLYINIFQVSTGERVGELSGSYSIEFPLQEDPLESFRNAVWISDRHFIVPTSGHRAALLCDMRPTASSNDTAWDFIQPTNEILGFWEDPYRWGYFNAISSLRLQAAARIADDGNYSVNIESEGPHVTPIPNYPLRLEAGIRSIGADLGYFNSDGRWNISAIKLMSGRARTVVSTATNLGPTEEYLSSYTHQQPEPPPFPSITGNRIPPPNISRRLPDSLHVAGLGQDGSGKFAALSVSIPLNNWPLSTCTWWANLLDRNGAYVDHASVRTLPRQKQVTFIFDGATISGNNGGPPWLLSQVQAQCQTPASGWEVLFDDNPLHRISLSKNNFATVPLPSQVKLTGQNTFDFIDADHDGFSEYLHVQFGVSTSRRNCTLVASITDTQNVLIDTLDLLQAPDGRAFFAYVEGSRFEDLKPGLFRFDLGPLTCDGQLIPLPPHTSVTTRLNAPYVRRPFKIALSSPLNSTGRHVEYWIDCIPETPIPSPLTVSPLPGSTAELQMNIEPQTAPCREHAFKISVDASDTLLPGNYQQVLHVHALGGGSWSGQEVRFDWRVYEAPQIFGVNPASGIGPEALFHVAATHRNGDIARVDLLINDRLEEQGGCYVSYFAPAPAPGNTSTGIVLHADDGRDVWAKDAGPAEGENNRCSILKGSDQLLRTVPIAFKPSFRGQKNVYARVIDRQGASSGWRFTGTWTASDEQAPEPVAMKPYLGSGSRQTFDFEFSDINGSNDIESAEVLIQFGRDIANACSISLDRNAGLLHLIANTGASDAGTLKIDTKGDSVQNGQCAVSDAELIPESRDALHLGMTVRFDPAFAGRRNIYARVRDQAGLSSPWRWLGSWVVPGR